MSHPNRPKARGPAPRRRRQHEFEGIERLEDKLVMAPVVSSTFLTAAFTAAATPTNANLGTVAVTAAARTTSPAPITSVTEFAPNSEYGGDIVQIAAGPGGDFGKGVYAISRGAGENANAANRAPGTPAPVNHPGAIYRIDPATGKASLFFDLNSVVSQINPATTSSNQISPNAPAGNNLGTATGLVNWYSITFDPEGTFDGKPSMFVSSVDLTDPNKNAIYQIGPDGSLLAVFAKFSSGQSSGAFNINPTAMLVPPVEQQSFLRGLIVSSGQPGFSGIDANAGAPTTTTTTTTTTAASTTPAFVGYFFDANAFRPGTNLTSDTNLPTGVDGLPFAFGPQVGLTSANTNYLSPVYSAFTNFGTPATTGIPALPGLSGVEGLGSTGSSLATTSSATGSTFSNASNLLIGKVTTTTGTGTTTGTTTVVQTIYGNFLTAAQVGTLTAPATATAPSGVDQASAVTTPFRRFQSIAFDQYGYFSSNAGAATTTTTGTTATTADTLPFAGGLFVSDLATGLAVTVTPIGGAPAIAVPIQGPGPVGVTVTTTTVNAVATSTATPLITNGNTTGGSNLGGRIIRIDPNGNVDVFATGFHTSGDQSSNSFLQSDLSISFSADGTTLYASDDDGIWQFKTVADLAGSTSGSITGLNDLRTLGVPYEGQNQAVAVVDTGVDASNPSFRGRVSTGTNVIFNGAGNDDTAPGSVFSSTTTGTTGTTASTTGFPDGHGTLIAGVIAQFVPQATIEPVNIFSPNTPTISASGTTGGTGNTTTTSQNSPAATTPQVVYQGLQYTAQHPFVADPVRPNKQDRVVAATLGFGTTRSFPNEISAYKKYSQFVLAVKNQLHALRTDGITPIAAAGQFGTEAGPVSTSRTGTTTTTTTTVTGLGDVKGMSLPATLNEVVSVTGTYPFPLNQSATSNPLNTFNGIVPRQAAPFLLSGLVTGLTSGTATTGTTAATGNSITALTADDSTIFADKLLSSANRGVTTDFAAPALDVPTFRRTVLSTAATGSTSAVKNPADLVFQQAGTSLSAAITAGAFALTSSALDYWSKLAQAGGSTVDAYLTTPVGAKALNFGPGQVLDLSSYANPDGVNAILQWTAVPAVDNPNTFADALPITTATSTGSTGGTTGGTTGATGTSGTPTVPSLFGTSANRSYSRVSISNAIAAIEGTEALNYLIKNNILPIIDGNKDGLLTAQEIQTFVDNSAAMGLPEAGAMARLLGGTARIPGTGNPVTGGGDSPDQPDVLQRRFNFFDFAANGRLAGVISIADLKLLSQKLLPQPDAFVVIDRQRSSQTNYLLDPTQPRASFQLQHIVPRAEWIPASRVARFHGVSPNAFGIGRFKGRTVNPFSTGPTFTLFDPSTTVQTTAANGSTGTQVASTPAPATTTPAPVSTPAQATTPTPAPTTPPAATTTTPATAPAATGGAGLAAQILQGQNSAATVPNTTGPAAPPTFTPVASNNFAGSVSPAPAGQLGTSKKAAATQPTAGKAPSAKVASTPEAQSTATTTESATPAAKKPTLLQLVLQSRKKSNPTA